MMNELSPDRPDTCAIEPLIEKLEAALVRLSIAIAARRSQESILRLWSQFVRLRDGGRCLNCNSTRRVSAHHICRKAFMPQARFQTGNGITLCASCHREAHNGFNGRPDMSLPMDAQGGEKIEILAELYRTLFEDAIERGLLRDEFYDLDESVLERFKRFQGFEPGAPMQGGPLEQAYRIWNQSPRSMRNAILIANGCDPNSLPDVMPGEAVIVFDN